MLDPNNYTAAGTFDGFRFVKKEQNRPLQSDETEPKKAIGEEEARTKFTDVDWKFPFWGASKRAWYVSRPIFLFLFSCRSLFIFPCYVLPFPSGHRLISLSQPGALVRLPLAEKHPRASPPELRLRAREPGRETSLLVDDGDRAPERSETEAEKKREAGTVKERKRNSRKY